MSELVSIFRSLLGTFESLVEWLEKAVSASGSKDARERAKRTETSGKADEAAAVEEDTATIQGDIDLLRKSLDSTGKRLGAIVATVLGAVGYTQIHQIFPFPPHASQAFRAGAIAAAAAGLGAATFLVVRFFFAQRRILVESDLLRLRDIPGTRRGIPWRSDWNFAVRESRRAASAEDAETLEDLDARAQRLARIARRLELEGGALAGAAATEAARLAAVVEREELAAAMRILEHRTRNTFGGVVGSIAIVLAVGGVGFTFALGDYAKGLRDRPAQRAQEALSCSESAAASKDLTEAQKTALVQACASLLSSSSPAPATTATTTTTTTTTGG